MDEQQTVYIVENDAPVRDSLAILLETAGFSPVAFGSAEDFLAGFHPEDNACLLMDLDLPGKSGLDLLKILGNRLHHLPVIVITGNVGIAIRAKALELGAKAVFNKPTNPDVLIATIRQATS